MSGASTRDSMPAAASADGRRSTSRGADPDAAAGGGELVERPVDDESAMVDDDHMVDGLGHFGEQMARHQDRAALGCGGGAAGHAASARRAGPARWWARRGPGSAGRRAGRRRCRAAAAYRARSRRPGGGLHRPARPGRAPRRPGAPGCRWRWRARAGGCGRCGRDGSSTTRARHRRCGPGRRGRVGAAVDGGRPGCRAHQPQQHAQRGGLAGPVAAEEAGDGSLGEVEAEVVDGENGPNRLVSPSTAMVGIGRFSLVV